MDKAKITEITLGDLIVALTEETTPVVADKRWAYTVVSYILSDLFLKRHVAFKNRSRQRPIAQTRAAQEDLYE